jgi:DNA-binding IclR family transcriptional regulator
MAGNTGNPGATVTARVIAVLAAFDERHRRLGVTDISRRSELPLSTTHRLLGELVAHGALQREGRDYVIGRRLWDVGLLAPVQADLREAASPFLHDIYAATRATVHLAVRDGNEALYLERLSGRSSVAIVSTVGSTLPLHATGVGKVLLAHAPQDLCREVLSRLSAVTPHTVTSPRTLTAQLERVRSNGYATTEDEMSLGACSVAVPVRRRGDVVAAIGVVVPTLKRDRGRLVAALQVAGRGIGRHL